MTESVGLLQTMRGTNILDINVRRRRWFWIFAAGEKKSQSRRCLERTAQSCHVTPLAL